MHKGINGSDGIGIGKAFIIKEMDLSLEGKVSQGAKVELERLSVGMNQFVEKTTAMAEIMKEKLGEKNANILFGHIQLAQDLEIKNRLVEAVNAGACAECAIVKVYDYFATIFENTKDEMIKQKATDLRDIKIRLLGILLGIEEVDMSKVPEGSILIAKDLTPSMTFRLNPDRVTGIVTETGGRTSHFAILAREYEIPAVLSVANICEEVSEGDIIIVDGTKGEVYVNPDQELMERYQEKRNREIEEKNQMEQFRGVSTITADGLPKELFVNIGKPEGVKKVKEGDGEGIGLFRTEFLFMNRHDLPSEEEQFIAYRTVAEGMKGKEVIIRTLDIGGDKEVPSLKLEKEENPFLGYRAIRFCLQRIDVYFPQLRAILRASAYGNIKIMIPFVTGVEELRSAKNLIDMAKEELDQDNIPYKKDIEVGVMMETPAACMVADLLAKEADFFSVGTNDLTGYTMAVDRGNSKVSYLYSTYHPAVLRAIKRIITCAKEEGIKVGMCGEAAADPKMIPLLLAFGLDEFSVSASAVLKTREAIANWTIEEAKELENLVMQKNTVEEVEVLLNNWSGYNYRRCR